MIVAHPADNTPDFRPLADADALRDGPVPSAGGGDLLRYALAYARFGWSVLPIEPGGKEPLGALVPHGLTDATTDADTIRRWWAARPDASVGIAMEASGFVALDVDLYNGDEAKLAALIAKHGPLPSTMEQMSGSQRGHHIIYRAPGFKVRGKLGGITVRAKNYLVAAPSTHKSGGRYQWFKGHGPGEIQVAELPDAWREALRKSADEVALDGSRVAEWETSTHVLHDEDAARLREILAALGPRQSGGSTTFHAISLVCHAFGQSVEDGAQFLIDWNKNCGTPHDGHSLARQVERVAQRLEPDDERGWAPEASAFWRAFFAAVNAKNTNERANENTGPSMTQLEATLEATCAKLKRRSNAADKLASKLLSRVLKGEILADESDLAHAAIAVARCVPTGTTSEQIRAVMLPCLSGAHVGGVDELVARAMEAAKGSEKSPGKFNINKQTEKPVASSQHNVRLALQLLGIRLRYDTFAERKVIVRDGDSELVTDNHVKRLRFEIDERFEFLPEKDFLYDLLTVIALEDEFHPVLEYFDQLPPWDGVPRVETWLIDLAGAENTAYTRAVSRLVLTAAARRVRVPGCKFDEMLVLESAVQGKDKSRFVKALCPNPDWFGTSFPCFERFDAERKMIEAISGKWIIEYGELKGMGSADYRAIKDQLQRTVDEGVMKWGRERAVHKRQFVVIGTTNDFEYLVDETGNRRIWPVPITQCDVERLLEVRDQLWAEAAFLERSHPEDSYIRLAPSLYEAAGKIQDSRREHTPIEQMLRTALGDANGRILRCDVWRLAGVEKRPTRAESKDINAAMRVLGWRLHPNVVFSGKRNQDVWVRGDGPDLVARGDVVGEAPPKPPKPPKP